MLSKDVTHWSQAAANLSGRLLHDASLADYTSWRVGGIADYLYLPKNCEDLSEFIKILPEDLAIYWLGLGSNVLIRDGGIAGVVIVTQGALNLMAHSADLFVTAQTGVACAQFARYTARLGLTGLEFMAGIPGTIGGALAMNAGCYGHETWSYVSKVTTLNRNGLIKTRPKADYEISYRCVIGPSDEWFVAASFELALGDKVQSLAQIKTLLAKRNAAQPTGLPNCGSVFRNPPNDFAARLIESCGLKEYAIGGAYVSPKHANFIINDGTATAKDIELLIAKIIQIVQEQTSKLLIPEVCIVGRSL
jgi:UDP-N-acetylmuramate dehydrogenase